VDQIRMSFTILHRVVQIKTGATIVIIISTLTKTKSHNCNELHPHSSKSKEEAKIRQFTYQKKNITRKGPTD